MVASTGGGIGSGIVSSGVVCSTGGAGSGDITLSSSRPQAASSNAAAARGRRPCFIACPRRRGDGCSVRHDFLPDRKRVVWGKSVSVRLAIGGCRFIKKNINKHTSL